MKTAHSLRRVRLARPRQPWTAVVESYLSAPRDYWPEHSTAHTARVEGNLRALSERDGLHASDIIAAVLSMAAKRQIGRPAGVHLTGLLASGTDQLARVLHAIPGLVAVGPVEMPELLLRQLRGYSDAEQACAVDAIQLFHGWPRHPDVWAAGIISTAGDVRQLPLYKRWFSATVGVHVVRDPRAQVRAAMLHARDSDGETADANDLRRALEAAAMSFANYRAVIRDVDLLCRYEDLRSDPGQVLRDVLRLLGRSADDRLIASALAAAELQGDPGTLAGEDPAQQRLVHAHLVDVIRGLGYPPDDCMGTHLPGGNLPARQLRFRSTPPGPLYQRRAGTWVPLVAGGGAIDVPPGTPVMLRIGTADPGGLAAVEGWNADDLQAVCLASNDRIDDNALRSLRNLRELQTLDLARTRVTDEGLAHLSTLTGLQQLHLAETGTTPAGRARLAKHLPQLTMWA